MASLTFCVSAALICQSPDKKLLKKNDALAVGAPAAIPQQRLLSNQREKDGQQSEQQHLENAANNASSVAFNFSGANASSHSLGMQLPFFAAASGTYRPHAGGRRARYAQSPLKIAARRRRQSPGGLLKLATFRGNNTWMP
jgi:hypothetical protein